MTEVVEFVLGRGSLTKVVGEGEWAERHRRAVERLERRMLKAVKALEFYASGKHYEVGKKNDLICTELGSLAARTLEDLGYWSKSGGKNDKYLIG